LQSPSTAREGRGAVPSIDNLIALAGGQSGIPTQDGSIALAGKAQAGFPPWIISLYPWGMERRVPRQIRTTSRFSDQKCLNLVAFPTNLPTSGCHSLSQSIWEFPVSWTLLPGSPPHACFLCVARMPFLIVSHPHISHATKTNIQANPFWEAEASSGCC
jgi:hypothetical protein